MKRTTGMLTALCVLALAGTARAEETVTPQPGSTTAPAQSEPAPAPAATETPAPDQAAPAAGKADALAAIRAEGKKVDAKVDQKATAALDAASNDLEKNVATDGDRKIAERLAAEFGSTPDALLAEKSELKASWGQLVIAHSLLANGTTDVTAKQLFDLRAEGMSWAQIANGMGLRLGEVVRATKEEVRVAKGLAKPDGKVAVVQGYGSKSEASARADAKAKEEKSAMKAAAKAEEAKADAAAKADDAKNEAAGAEGAKPAEGKAEGKAEAGGKNK